MERHHLGVTRNALRENRLVIFGLCSIGLRRHGPFISCHIFLPLCFALSGTHLGSSFICYPRKYGEMIHFLFQMGGKITRSLLPVLQLDWEPQLGEGPLPSDWMPIFQRTNSWQTPRLQRLQCRHQTGVFWGGLAATSSHLTSLFFLFFHIPRPHLSMGSKSGLSWFL